MNDFHNQKADQAIFLGDQKILQDDRSIEFILGIFNSPVDNLWISRLIAVDNLWIKLWTSG